MAEECEHLRRHSGDKPDQASDDDADFDIEESCVNHNTRPFKHSATPYRTTIHLPGSFLSPRALWAAS